MMVVYDVFPQSKQINYFVRLRMDLHLIPLRLVLAAKVTISIKIPFCCRIRFTIWRQNIWSYSTPLIEKSPLFYLTTKDKDPDPPEFRAVSYDGEEVCNL